MNPASPIGDDAEHDCDFFTETGILGFVVLCVCLLGYGLWVLL